MIKQILCALLVAGFVLLPSQWMKVQATENATPTASSSEAGDIYVRTIAPLSQNEAETYSDLSKESLGLANLKAGEEKDPLVQLLVVCGILVLVAILSDRAKAQREAKKSGY